MTPGSESPLSVVHLVVTDAFAGVERYVCQVANELAARGHHVVTIGGDGERMHQELVAGVTNRPAAGLVAGARALARVGHVDVVHVHMTAAEASAWLARPWQRSPIVATRHFARDRGSSATARGLATVTSRAIACDIAISQFVADSISGPCVVIPNGVSDRDQAPLDTAKVVMLQRLEAEKSTDMGIRAWARSGLADRDWRLLVGGQGELQGSLVQLALDLGVADSVEFLGYVGDTDKLLSEASVLMAPGHLDGFGLSVVEAMAHGVPVVAARAGGHIETLADDGLLFPPGDPAAAARELVRLQEDPSLRRSVGSALRRRQRDLFSLPRHVDRLEAVYRQVIAGGHPDGR
jgi:glycosyltransferase involved in cell wall biosynthesis